jgi:hypothetical protein
MAGPEDGHDRRSVKARPCRASEEAHDEAARVRDERREREPHGEDERQQGELPCARLALLGGRDGQGSEASR